MAPKGNRVNPFYVLLVLVGVAFALTACAYGVMAVKEMHASDFPFPLSAPESSIGAKNDDGFVEFMDQHGVRLMVVELGLLALTTFAAIGTDRIWTGER